MISPAEAVKLQQRMAKRVISHDVVDEHRIRRICGVDVSYRGDEAFACAVVVDRKSLAVIDTACKRSRVRSPYIPGLFFLREAGPILTALEGLGEDYDALFVDGHGLLHPRRFGLACHIGLEVGKPTVGVGKSLLCGRVVENDDISTIMLDGKKLGVALGKKWPVYVSVGHMISLRTAVKLVRETSKYKMPEPLRLAHLGARRMMLGSAGSG